ncbi:aldo/keto reductase [Cellulomonas sp. PhB143]|uniref:aldo/keto reductase n=1 Tax=Cellulomonas sp. PhB143 TaxID=2485186 RepID=UPI000F4784D6|nr:aldo/keto reductase [Cellulomonas sp. PhB143]ROS75389.1 aryl-alcohol dehydrogenase-like predicted oxidoreductase [Cellulomonas sp. PhB143]
MSTTTTSSSSNAPRPGGSAPLGDHAVARVGYGAMQLERLRGDRDAAVSLLRRAVELGIDHVDTAQFYGDGLSNGLLREALRPEDGVTIVSKIGADPHSGGPAPMRPAQKPAELRASVEDNLRSLGVDQIPVVNLRRMEGRVSIPVPDDQIVDLDDQLAAMTAMRDEGLVGAFGLSSVTLETLRRALPAGVACVQNPYSLVARDDEELLELCEAEGIAWVPFFPLGSAFPGMPKVVDVPEVRTAAQALGVTPSQVGLAWLLHRSPRTLLIPGTTSVGHLEENVAAGDIVLDASTLAALDASVPPAAGSIA